jgi:hypothetical protein
VVVVDQTQEQRQEVMVEVVLLMVVVVGIPVEQEKMDYLVPVLEEAARVVVQDQYLVPVVPES